MIYSVTKFKYNNHRHFVRFAYLLKACQCVIDNPAAVLVPTFYCKNLQEIKYFISTQVVKKKVILGQTFFTK